MAVMDVGLQAPPFTRDLATDAGLHVLVAVSFGKSRKGQSPESQGLHERGITGGAQFDNTLRNKPRQRADCPEGKARRGLEYRGRKGLPWRAT